jgi:hypothetical protein
MKEFSPVLSRNFSFPLDGGILTASLHVGIHVFLHVQGLPKSIIFCVFIGARKYFKENFDKCFC